MPLPPRWLIATMLFLGIGVGSVVAQRPDVEVQGRGKFVGSEVSQRGAIAGERPTTSVRSDEQLLESLSIGTDGPGLLQFFQKRTLKNFKLDEVPGQRTIEPQGPDRLRIALLVRRLGDDLYSVREQAANELVVIGIPATSLLRQACEHADLEVKQRAEGCLAAIEMSPGRALPLAAIRLLRHRMPDGACNALLNYLPFVPDETVEEEILLTLPTVGLRNGKWDPQLRAALSATDAHRRAAAAMVMGQYGGHEERTMVRRLLADTNPQVRLRAAQGLIAGREGHAAATLVALLGDSPIDVASQAEDLLSRLAGDRAPRVDLELSPASRRRCQETWAAWLRGNQDRLDLTRAPELIVLNPERRAIEVAERFLNAYVQFDVESLKRQIDLPFFDLDDNRVIRNREGIERVFQEALNFRGENGVTFTLRSSKPFADHYKSLPQPQKTLLARYRRPEIHVVNFAVLLEDIGNGDAFAQTGTLIIRVGNGGVTRVVGISSGDDFNPRGR